ncbi:transglycosylase family protein [Streptomyces bambusae]|uniref:Peptidoglycan DD-metalloendopeptidase family protein n=1 Tax=Streptomyces bambusae TaxID=1550616 RepID=A0ABS6YYT3_9ACTN|nr:transglycosylase family protein [Streptomyces bambusae]MBW5480627.1 peptidoglycan DD-metalloendopeptidase family protein [Streptomyces bambusae]
MRYRHASVPRSSFKHRTLLAVAAATVPLALASPQAHGASTETWDKVAECESSGNWSINSGNGFYGGLQFTDATWAAFGGHDHAPQAHQASREAQIAVAEKVLDKQGPKAWPVCSATAGLTRDGETPTPAVTPSPAAPDTTPSTEPSTTPTDSPACEANGSFTVERGDTLNSLASRLCVEWEDLRDENAIPDDTDPDENLRPGMLIKHCHGHHAQPEQNTPQPSTPEPNPETNTATPESKPASGPAQPATAELNTTAKGTLPVTGGAVTTPYKQPGSWAAGFHTGIDFAVPTGTSVVAATEGTVVTAGRQGSYGNAVIIKHPSGMHTLYAHLQSVSVRQGDPVDKAQEIGLSGSTGNSTGPHLHFEARTSNNYSAHTDPVAYLRSLGVPI